MSEADSDIALAAAAKALLGVKETSRDLAKLSRLVDSIGNIRGFDGHTPIKGIDYDDGVDGEDGEKGERGDDGIGVTLVEDRDDDFIIKLDDGRQFPIQKIHGKAGDNGEPGEDGADGVGVKTVWVENGYLFVQLTDERVIEAGYVRGDKGEDGVGLKGEKGSAPEHQIKTDAKHFKLRFRNPNGSWGNWINIPRKQTFSVLSGATSPSEGDTNFARQTFYLTGLETTVLSTQHGKDVAPVIDVLDADGQRVSVEVLVSPNGDVTFRSNSPMVGLTAYI